jgi:hypothetical protein
MTKRYARGQSLVEYAILLAIVVVAVVVGLIIPVALVMLLVRGLKGRNANAE